MRALRYYESIGLVVPSRLPNGYRDYDPVSVRQIEEIRGLTGLGLLVQDTRPFVECLASGHGRHRARVYPVRVPELHAVQVLDWLRAHPGSML